MMRKRIIEYTILSLGILMLALSVYNIIHYFTIDTSWNIFERVNMGSGNSNIEQEADRMIKIYGKDPSIGEMMFTIPDLTLEDRQFIEEKLGINTTSNKEDNIISKSYGHNRLYNTGTGCDLLRVLADTTVNIMWTNTIDNGTVSFTIKDINGNKIFDENRSNISIQDKLVLEPGDYFIYKDFNNVVNLKYNLFIESN